MFRLEGRVLKTPEGGWEPVVRAIRAGKLTELVDTWVPFPESEARFRGTRRSLLYWACASGLTEIVRALIESGADASLARVSDVASGGRGATDEVDYAPPLEVATVRGHVAIVGILLAAGANPEGHIKANIPPLFHAVTGPPTSVRLLLAHGADPRRRTKGGETPMDQARKHGRSEAVAVLREALLARVANEPGATLRVKKSRTKPGGPFSTFANRRIAAGFHWCVCAVGGDVEAVGAALQRRGVGIRWEKDCATRRVLGNAGPVWLLRLDGSKWTWVLFALQAIRFRDWATQIAHAEALSRDVGTDTRLFIDAFLWVHRRGKLIAEASYSAEEERATGRASGSFGPLERGLLAKADAYCKREGLLLPAMQEDSDGFELILTIKNQKTSDIQRLDALVVED